MLFYSFLAISSRLSPCRVDRRGKQVNHQST